MSDTDGGPAFPRHYGTSFSAERETSNWHGGMTLRDYFAAKAMAELLGWPDVTTEQGRAHIAVLAYQMADALIAERAK